MNSFKKPYWGFGGDADTMDTRPIIVQMLNTYLDHPAQFLYKGQAVISGYSGDAFPWPSVLSQVTSKNKPGLFPNFHDLTTYTKSADLVAGGLSWYAWPTDGQNGPAKVPMDTSWDVKYKAAIGSKPYIAPLSPWFFCHLKTSADFGPKGKNWCVVWT
jgi:glucan endo-1,3-alpha-glucosidase